MIDYKKLQSEKEDPIEQDGIHRAERDDPRKRGIVGDSRIPYHPEQRSTESNAKIINTLNSFYSNKEQYDAFVRVVGKDVANNWMGGLLLKATEKK